MGREVVLSLPRGAEDGLGVLGLLVDQQYRFKLSQGTVQNVKVIYEVLSGRW
jgi:hypothetical protein